ncbi:serine/threonine-protein kinase [Pirellulales bacterium]|nr:serine/threonine-protein kinase [Pirellulales bacterium]
MKPLRARQRLGKYVIERKLGEGGFARVYAARDTIEGVRVALKIPREELLNDEALEYFRREVRLVARLDHPNILPLKTADFIDGRFVIASLLGKSTLDERLRRRLALETALHFAREMLRGAAYAHENHIIHCDVKPENFILFDDNRLRLADFGVARIAFRTLRSTGAGTLGYMAPEQAMGRPTFSSDVFSLGLIFYRMFSGRLPEWPFHWPPPGINVLQKKLHRDMVKLIQRALEVTPQRRFRDAQAMLAAWERMKPLHNRQRTSSRQSSTRNSSTADWRRLRHRQFVREFGKHLPCPHACARCEGPVADSKDTCGRCGWGVAGTYWSYCPWCAARREGQSPP